MKNLYSKVIIIIGIALIISIVSCDKKADPKPGNGTSTSSTGGTNTSTSTGTTTLSGSNYAVGDWVWARRIGFVSGGGLPLGLSINNNILAVIIDNGNNNNTVLAFDNGNLGASVTANG